MVLSLNEEGCTQNMIHNFSVETVRNLLNIDNKGIAKLCAQASMLPKKDENGKTYFSKEDIEILRKLNSKNIAKSEKQMYVSRPVSNIALPVPDKSTQLNANNVVSRICTSLSNLEDSLTQKMSTLLEESLDKKLDEKLDGMDEVVVELVRCKTENETLRYKLNELNKELYNVKNELSRYKALGFGLYVKNSKDSNLI